MIYLYILGSIIIINFWIAAKTQTVFPNKSIIYRKKPQQWSVVKCLVLLWISILPWEILKFGEPLGKKGTSSAILLKKKRKKEIATWGPVWHGGHQGLCLWLSGNLWNCFLMFCQMLLRCFYIINILVYFQKNIKN